MATSYFEQMLSFDPLAEAENITGKSYKEDEETKLLGLALHLRHAQLKKTELSLRDDTYYGMTMEDYLRVLGDLGFEKVHEAPSERDGDIDYLFWHSTDHLLLTTDTYGKTVNAATVYFNCRFPNIEAMRNLPLSGYLVGDLYDQGDFVWSGYLHAREGLRQTVGILRDRGQCIAWVENPLIRKIPEDVVAALPETLQEDLRQPKE